jgi:adenosylmethionine-8-amino-7-oxononanoate aminotransferase
MTYLLHRQLGFEPPFAVAADGIFLIDQAGHRFLDGSSGAAVSCLGHTDADVIAAIERQLHRLPYAHTSFFSTEPAEEAATLLVENAPGQLNKVFFVSSGSEAVEAAIKIARQYHVERGQPQRRHIVGRWQSYHGNTLGALAAGGNRWRRTVYEPLLFATQHISPCYAYRGQGHNETLKAYGERVAGELDELARELDPDSIAAFIAEPVVGATLGAVPPVTGYFKRIREICDHFGILLIFDEVMCGMGRTGTLFASEQEDVVPDLICIAKGLGAGYQPIAAMLVAQHIHETIAAGSGAFLHGHTYLAHPAACAAAAAVLRKITQPQLLAQVRSQGDVLIRALKEKLADHPYVGDIRGRGLFVGIEFVNDRVTKEPFAPELRLHQRIKDAAAANGLLCYPMGGTLDGRRGDHVLIAPPFIITEDEIHQLIDRLAVGIDAAVAHVAGSSPPRPHQSSHPEAPKRAEPCLVRDASKK